MKNIFLILFLLSFLCSYSQLDVSKQIIELEKYIVNNDTLKIKEFHQKIDCDFSSEWELFGMEENAEIDHFKFGYVFEWLKKRSDTIYYRTFIFDADIKLCNVWEKREINGKLISRGDVKIEKGHLKYIRQAYPKDNLNEFKVKYYEYEFFKNGELISIYRTEHLNHLEMLTDVKNKSKVELVMGVDCLKIK